MYIHLFRYTYILLFIIINVCIYRYGIAYLINSSWIVLFFRFEYDELVTSQVLGMFYTCFPSYNPAHRGAPAPPSSVEMKSNHHSNKINQSSSSFKEWHLASGHEQAPQLHVQSVIPALVDKATAKRLTGHLFDESKFDLNADKESGTITREQFMARCHEKRGVNF
jgi:hypothetical protein